MKPHREALLPPRSHAFGDSARRCERPLCAVVILKWSGSLEAYPPLWPPDESVTLLPWFKFGVKTIMATSGDSRRVITQQLLRPPHTKPRRLFQRQHVDTSPQEAAAASKGEVNFGFNPLQMHHTPNQTGRFYQGATVSRQPLHSLITGPGSRNANQPPRPKTTKAQRSKACSADWPSTGPALRKCSVDKSKAAGCCSRISPLQAG